MAQVQQNGGLAAKPATASQRVLIIGGGYGGLRAALKLAQSKRRTAAVPLEIVLLDMNDYHQVITELHQVAGGRATAESVRVPFAKILRGTGVRFVQARVVEFDFGQQRVIVETKADGVTSKGAIPYRWLLLALGSTTAFFGIPGLKEHAFTIKSAWEANRVAAQMLANFQAAAALPTGDQRQGLLTFVVGGGGFSGVELAGEFAERIASLCQQFSVPRAEVKLLIIEAQGHVLPGYPDWMVRYASQSLAKLGVTVVTGDPVATVQADSFSLKSGRTIPNGLLVWTGGVEAVSEARQAGAATGRGGRVVVNEYLEATDYPGVFAIGDNGIAADSSRALPPSAQIALQQAETVAANIFAQAGGQQRREEFRPNVVGEVISIGSRDAIANLESGVKLTGTPATVLKNLIEQRYRLSLSKGPLGDLAMISNFI